jgi:hypothetical protein
MDESPNPGENENPEARLTIFRCPDGKKGYRMEKKVTDEGAGGALKIRLLVLSSKQDDDNLTLSDKNLHAGL